MYTVTDKTALSFLQKNKNPESLYRLSGFLFLPGPNLRGVLALPACDAVAHKEFTHAPAYNRCLSYMEQIINLWCRICSVLAGGQYFYLRAVRSLGERNLFAVMILSLPILSLLYARTQIRRDYGLFFAGFPKRNPAKQTEPNY